MNTSSKLLITMGDVAGVGPEIIAKAWPALNKICRPIVVGDPEWMKKAILLVNPSLDIETITDPGKASPNSNKISCLKIPTADLSDVAKCKISAKAGQAAHDFRGRNECRQRHTASEGFTGDQYVRDDIRLPECEEAEIGRAHV